jgi:hypothetical protein
MLCVSFEGWLSWGPSVSQHMPFKLRLSLPWEPIERRIGGRAFSRQIRLTEVRQTARRVCVPERGVTGRRALYSSPERRKVDECDVETLRAQCAQAAENGLLPSVTVGRARTTAVIVDDEEVLPICRRYSQFLDLSNNF